nr:GTPase [Kibdelosporangium phytohabitans]
MLDDVRQRVAVIDRRVHRDSLNLGVVGLTKAGKSTLLRAITGLREDVIPSSDYSSTTAAVSRIFNRPGAAETRVTFHTWHSFRSNYLAPLHVKAGEGAAPGTLEEFIGRKYKPGAGLGSEDVPHERFRRKIRIAQESVASWRGELGSQSQQIPITHLRPYVSYPRKDDPQHHRPYHAVREVHIWKEFPALGSTRIGLVDLPGTNEAGLDVDRHFAEGLRNDVDLLLLVKKPDSNSAQMTEADWEPLNQARAACAGVRLEDFVFGVLNNHYPPGDENRRYFDNAVAALGREFAAFGDGIRHTAVSANDKNDVRRQLMAPVLEHLADRISHMDHDALGHVRTEVLAFQDQLTAFTREVLERATTVLHGLPDEKRLLLELADAKCNQIGEHLQELAESLAGAADQGVPDPRMADAVTRAAGEVRRWVREKGLGSGTREQWLKQPARGVHFKQKPLEATEYEYSRMRSKVTEAFGGIDASLHAATEQLRADIAAVFQAELGLVSTTGPSATADWQKLAASRQAHRLAHAFGELGQLRKEYGSVLLRVGRPIIQRINFTRRTPPPAQGGKPAAGSATWQDPFADGAVFVAAEAVRVAADTVVSHVTRGVPKTADELYSDLTQAVEQAVDEIEKALLAEAASVSIVLAAAATQFWDEATLKRYVTRDYENLCGPDAQRIWPAEFGAGSAALSAALSKVTELAQAVLASTADLAAGW